MNRRRGLFTVLLSITLLAGCAADNSQTAQGEPSLPEVLPRVDMATFSLPLSAYSPTEEQGQALMQARNMLVVRCLAEFGFIVEPPDLSAPSPIGINEGRYLLADANRARTYGYKVPEITNRPRPAEPELTPEAEAVITGDGASVISGKEVPAGGCLGQARRELGADTANPEIDLLQQLSNEAYDRMKQDSRVVAAKQKWSDCMARSGYHYPDPGRANDDPVFATPIASEAEIATAVADVECKNETNLINIMAAVETAYQQRAIEKHEQGLQELKTKLDVQVRIAADVIAGKR